MLQTDTIKIKCTREEISSNERTTGAYRGKKNKRGKKKKKRNARDTHEITEAISTWIQRGREEQQMGEKDD